MVIAEFLDLELEFECFEGNKALFAVDSKHRKLAKLFRENSFPQNHLRIYEFSQGELQPGNHVVFLEDLELEEGIARDFLKQLEQLPDEERNEEHLVHFEGKLPFLTLRPLIRSSVEVHLLIQVIDQQLISEEELHLHLHVVLFMTTREVDNRDFQALQIPVDDFELPEEENFTNPILCIFQDERIGLQRLQEVLLGVLNVLYFVQLLFSQVFQFLLILKYLVVQFSGLLFLDSLLLLQLHHSSLQDSFILKLVNLRDLVVALQ